VLSKKRTHALTHSRTSVRETLGELLPSIRTPVLVIGGRRDDVVPPVNAEYLHERLPASRLAFVDSGHFTWEDAAGEYASLVTAWWNGGYAGASS
jgi:pimeloyl-ACP methyl ester carboxylesterase